MEPSERKLFAAVVLLAVVVVSRGSPAMSGDAPYYLAVSHSIAHDGDLDLRNQVQRGGSYLFQRHVRQGYARAGEDGRLLPSQGLGFSLLLTPVYALAELAANGLPDAVLARARWDRERAARDLISFVMACLAAWLAVLTLRLTRRLGGAGRRPWLFVALAFASPPLVMASIQAGPEVPAALLIVAVLLAATGQRRPMVAAMCLALLPWLHLRYGLVTVAGLVWLLPSSRRAAAVPAVSLALVAATTWMMFGSIWPPPFPDLPRLTVWRWLTTLPASAVDPDSGLLWVAPFWLLAIGGVAGLAREHPGAAGFVGAALAGLVLLAQVFENGLPVRVPGMLLAPMLPALVPALTRGWAAMAAGWRRGLALALVVWGIAYAALGIDESRRLIAEPGKGIGRLPLQAISRVGQYYSPEAKAVRMGFTADTSGLLAAVRGGHEEALALLLDAGLDPGAGVVAAVQSGQAGSLALLLARGAANGTEAARALSVATALGRTALADRLTAAGVTLDTAEATGETLLMTAVRYRRRDEYTSLLKLGADVNASTRTGQTALSLAVLSGDTAAVRDLIAAGARVNVADVDGWTPLMVAARWGYAPEVRLLLAAGADANARSRLGWTPLMWAARDGSADNVAALLAAGADPNATSAAGRTALIGAAGAGHQAVVALLLARGADPAIRVDDADARSWAMRNGHDSVAAQIAKRSAAP